MTLLQAGWALPIVAFVMSVFLTMLVRRWAIATAFASSPRPDRYNQKIVALGGGIAIFWTIELFLVVGLLVVQFLVVPGHMPFLGGSITQHAVGFMSKAHDLWIVAAVAAGLHVMGLYDDKKGLGPSVKLVVQFVAATIAAVFADIRVEMFIHNPWITTVLSIFWIVLIMNAFNFLDNMDGCSAGIAAIATAVLMVAAVRSGQVFVGALGGVFVGTLLGFLVFNVPPAKIFMGDCGSLVVGFFVALLTLRTTYYDPAVGTQLFSVFMPLLVMAVPLYDFISVTFLRIRQGKSPFVGDTQHFSHRLKRRGLSDLQVALTLYLATLFTGLGAVVLQTASLTEAIIIFAQTIMMLIMIAILEASGRRQLTSPGREE